MSKLDIKARCKLCGNTEIGEEDTTCKCGSNRIYEGKDIPDYQYDSIVCKRCGVHESWFKPVGEGDGLGFTIGLWECDTCSTVYQLYFYAVE